MASASELVSVGLEQIDFGQQAPGVTDLPPTFGLIEEVTGSSPNFLFIIDWDEGTKSSSVLPPNVVILREPTAATKLLLASVVQPAPGGIQGDAALAVLPSRSAELRGVVVGTFLAQRENGSAVVTEDFGQVLLVRVGVPPVDQDGPAPQGQWYFMKVSDAVVIANA